MKVKFVKACIHPHCNKCIAGNLCCLECEMFCTDKCGQTCVVAQQILVKEKDRCENQIEILDDE